MSVHCEACKRPIQNPKSAHVDADGRFEHRECTTGRAATVVREQDYRAGQR